MDLDIDIDPKVDLLKIFPRIIPAGMILNNEYKKHPVGYYFQNIPVDEKTSLAAIPYDLALDRGYNKIDFLNLSILENFVSKQEMKDYLEREPNWNLLLDKEVVDKLFHISNHYDLIFKIKPKTIEDLSDVLALIRPNKIKLLNKYLINKEIIRQELYTKRDKTDLRKSHALAYALLIVLQLHLISENRL